MPYPIASVRGGHAPPYLRGIAAAEEHGTTYSDIVMAAGPIAYWPLWETSGTVAEELVGGYDGTYSADVLTLGTQEGVGDGNEAVTFGRTPAYVDIYSAELAALWDGDEFSIICCLQPTGEAWGDEDVRRAVSLFIMDGYQTMIYKAAALGAMTGTRVAGGSNKNVSVSGLEELEEWIFWGLAVSDTANELKFYQGGLQVGLTKTGIVAWDGALAAATTLIGAKTKTPTEYFIGGIAHVAIFGQALSAETMLTLAP